MRNFILVEGEQSRQGSEEWLKFREGKIGASDAPAIAGISPWETKLECWERFILGTRKEKTAAMMRGNKFEDRARQLFCELYNDSFPAVVAQMASNEKIIASLDGWNGTKILEIKCPNKETHLMARRGEVPIYYFCQMQHQMMVMGCKEAEYCSYDTLADQIATVPVKRDDKYIESLLSMEMAFLASLIDFKAPEASDRDWVQIEDPSLNETALHLKSLILVEKKMQKEKEELKLKLIEGCKHPRVILNGIRMQKVISKGRIDYDAVVEKYGIRDLDRFRGEKAESWRFTS